MMQKKNSFLFITILLSACTTTLSIEAPSPETMLCHKQGGTAESHRNTQGNYDEFCVFPDGKKFEIKEYYRQNKPQ